MLNKVQIIGWVGKDPEIRYSANGDAIASFTIATSERHKDKRTGEMVEKTEWHNVIAFKRLAEIIQEYISKGSLMYIDGKIQTRNYEKAGVVHYCTSVVASEIKMLGRNNGGQKQRFQQRPAKPFQDPRVDQSTDFNGMNDEIPF